MWLVLAFGRAGQQQLMFEIDACPLLPLIHAPTLLLHRTGAPLVPIKHGRVPGRCCNHTSLTTGGPGLI
jgi:hypothetical protein